MYTNKKRTIILKDKISRSRSGNEFSLSVKISEISEKRPELLKIMNQEALALYVCSDELNKIFPFSESSISIVVAQQTSGPEKEAFEQVKNDKVDLLPEHFYRVFSPKAHLYFTNSIFASQVAIDYKINGLINTVNSTSMGLEQAFILMQSQCLLGTADRWLLFHYNNQKNIAIASIFSVMPIEKDDVRIEDIQVLKQIWSKL